MELKQIFNTWRGVFTNWKYLTTALIIALVFYSLNVLISSWNSLIGFYSSLGFFGTINFFFILWLGFKSTIIWNSFISLIIISILLGFLTSLIFYKISFNNSIDKKIGLFGGFGLFLAVFVPGCATCGVGLLAILGLGAGALSFFPYDGLELSIISIGILGFSILNITKNMNACKVSQKNLYSIKIKN